ncbi:hypothetical protein AVEN_215505-1 [Araneus ventricosus]|uniref:Tc1-like transposase DDE domain-containing protein n=1 Tax=Araneus ventricosus TaxID=182803 RepID=A0A4Y2BER0_ARAVE|nr:hypothetical protein AVEN_215505-1 [Araneus ventricosus]
MITAYGCGGALENGTIPPTLSCDTLPAQKGDGLGAITYASRSTPIVQDNARPRTALITQDIQRHVQTLPWPARSPDLSPIEHVWDQLKRQMPLCYSVHNLEVDVQDVWVHLPQDNIRRLINAMPGRVEACIAAGGGPTHY